MRSGCPVRNLVCCCALALASVPVLAVGGCGAIPFDAGFQPSADENIMGTLVDDRGSFTFNLNPETGNIQRIDADNGTITPPTDGQDLSIARDTGGKLTISPEGASDVIVAIRDDPMIGEDIVLTVARDTLDGLEPLIRQNAQAKTTCAGVEAFLIEVCTQAREIDVAEIVSLVSADLESRGQDPPAAAVMEALLEFYLAPFIDCCLAWDEFRDGGGTACTEG